MFLVFFLFFKQSGCMIVREVNEHLDVGSSLAVTSIVLSYFSVLESLLLEQHESESSFVDVQDMNRRLARFLLGMPSSQTTTGLSIVSFYGPGLPLMERLLANRWRLEPICLQCCSICSETTYRKEEEFVGVIRTDAGYRCIQEAVIQKPLWSLRGRYIGFWRPSSSTVDNSNNTTTLSWVKEKGAIHLPFFSSIDLFDALDIAFFDMDAKRYWKSLLLLLTPH
jgi:hypothetical protein